MSKIKDEKMEKVSGGGITTNIVVTLTGDDALAYLNSHLYKNRKVKKDVATNTDNTTNRPVNSDMKLGSVFGINKPKE